MHFSRSHIRKVSFHVIPLVLSSYLEAYKSCVSRTFIYVHFPTFPTRQDEIFSVALYCQPTQCNWILTSSCNSVISSDSEFNAQNREYVALVQKKKKEKLIWPGSECLEFPWMPDVTYFITKPNACFQMQASFCDWQIANAVSCRNKNRVKKYSEDCFLWWRSVKFGDIWCI